MNKAEITETEQEIIQEIILEEPKSNAALMAPDTNIEIESDDLLIPQMNVGTPAPMQNDSVALISDDKYMGVLDEVLDNMRKDRTQVGEYLDNMADMVINSGDATDSSKEAMVNLVKAKTDISNGMLKALDIMTRLKSKNTYAYSGPHLNAMQQNNFNIGNDSDNNNLNRKELLKVINKAKKGKK